MKKFLIDTNILIHLTKEGHLNNELINLGLFITKSTVEEFIDNYEGSGERDSSTLQKNRNIINEFRKAGNIIEPYEFIFLETTFYNIENTGLNIIKNSAINDAELFLFSNTLKSQTDFIICSSEPRVLNLLHTSQNKLDYRELKGQLNI